MCCLFWFSFLKVHLQNEQVMECVHIWHFHIHLHSVYLYPTIYAYIIFVCVITVLSFCHKSWHSFCMECQTLMTFSFLTSVANTFLSYASDLRNSFNKSKYVPTYSLLFSSCLDFGCRLIYTSKYKILALILFIAFLFQ